MRRHVLTRITGATLGLIGAAIAACAAWAAAPEKPSLDAILDGIQRHYEATRSFRADFTEELTSVGGPKRTRQGTVYYRKPGRMRWEFDEPQRATIVSDGATLYSYEPDLNQVVESPLAQLIKSASATAFLLGIGNIRRDFDASLPAAAPPAGLVSVALVPKGGGQRIELGLDATTYDVLALRITDTLGNLTVLHFKNIQTNVALADALFTFKVPAGADIVHAPQAP